MNRDTFIEIVRDALAPKPIVRQPTGEELRALNRDLALLLADSLEHDPSYRATVASIREEYGSSEREYLDGFEMEKS